MLWTGVVVAEAEKSGQILKTLKFPEGEDSLAKGTEKQPEKEKKIRKPA